MADPNAPRDTEPRRSATTRRARKKKATVDQGRRTREFNFRGRELSDLQALSQEEILQLLPSRARRYFNRGLSDTAAKLYEKVKSADEGAEIRTHLREFPITPHFVGKTMMVYNGRQFTKVVVTTEMIGHKLGEFALTRTTPKHTGPGVGATRSSKFMPLK